MSASTAQTTDDSGALILQRPGLWLDRLTAGMNAIGSAWLFVMMFMVVAEVCSRSFFNQPIRGVTEIVGQSIVIILFLQLANTLAVGRFTRAEMFTAWLRANRPVAADIYSLFFHLAGAIVLLPMFYSVAVRLEKAWKQADYIGVEGIFTFPVWPVLSVILLGTAVTVLQFLFFAARDVGFLSQSLRNRAADQPVGWIPLLMLAALTVFPIVIYLLDIDRLWVGVIVALGLFVLIYGGMFVAVGLLVLAFVGIWIIKDAGLASRLMALAVHTQIAQFLFAVVPMFVLMGLLVSIAEIGKDTFDVAAWLFRKVKGGLGISTVAANAVFAAITGVSIASAAVFAKIAVPQMVNHGYTTKFATGIVAGSSVLGMLIPPSILLIVYGFLAEVSVGTLFIAAVIPGIILASAFALMILVMAIAMPLFVGAATDEAVKAEDETMVTAAIKLVPVFVLVILVLGGIYGVFEPWFGFVFSPTEAGAIGAAGALVIALVKRRLNWTKLWRVLVETGHVTVSILFLIIAANIYSRMLAYSGLPNAAAHLIEELGVGMVGFFVAYLILIVIMGMIVDSISIMLLVLPIAIPVMNALGGDLIWFGVVTVIAIEIGLLTPPFGLTVFVVRTTLGEENVKLGEIFIGAAPFVVIMLLVTILVIAVPDLSLVLLE